MGPGLWWSGPPVGHRWNIWPLIQTLSRTKVGHITSHPGLLFDIYWLLGLPQVNVDHGSHRLALTKYWAFCNLLPICSKVNWWTSFSCRAHFIPLSLPRIVFILITGMGWTKVWIWIHFHHSLVATWGPGPKSKKTQSWNMAYAADEVVVVWGCTMFDWKILLFIFSISKVLIAHE